VKIHPDFRDFIHALNNNHVEYVLVGSFALAYHGHPRATGDMDVWIRPTKQNASAVLKAVNDFGFEKVNVTEEDFLSGKIIQLGFPPVRIDIITSFWTVCRMTRYGGSGRKVNSATLTSLILAG